MKLFVWKKLFSLVFLSMAVYSFLSASTGPVDIGLQPTPGLGTITSVSKQQVNERFKRNTYGHVTNVTAANKHNLPDAANIGVSRGYTSFVKQDTKKNHPSGGQLFPDDPKLGQLLEAFLEGVGKKPNFLVFFSKIHLLMLHQLYTYLTSIHASFAITHMDTIPDYLTSQEQYALNQKTLIINHLVNIIEAQTNQAIRARFPAMPKNMATYAGTVLMKHDYGSDLTLLLEKSEDMILTGQEGKALIQGERTAYLTLYGSYLAFFSEYTKTLNQEDPSKSDMGLNVFLAHAQKIKPIIEKLVPKLEGLSADQKANELANIKKINPPLFFYDETTMRGLKLLPLLAQQIPPGVQSVPWPKQVVDNANSGAPIQPIYGPPLRYPYAYWTTGPTGKKRLFVNIPTPQYLYAQELLEQPAWLNSTQGVMLMTRACLGDFAALFDPIFAKDYIFDPCMECITRNAAALAGVGTHSNSSCRACQAFIKGIEDKIKQDEKALSLPPTSPAMGTGMPEVPDTTVQVPDAGMGP